MGIGRWIGLGAAAGLIAVLSPIIQGKLHLDPSLSKVVFQNVQEKPPELDLRGLDLMRLDLRPQSVTSPLPGGRTAVLTIDPVVQRAATRVMRKYNVPEAGVVALSVKTGEVIAYASHVSDGPKFDVNARAEAPAASVFKVVTASALVEKGGLNNETEQCYRGGRSSISADELREDPRRDKWCATLGIALGRSLNVVFGRLAQKHLTPEDIMEMGGAFGFGAPVPFAVENEAPAIDVPDEPLEFARTAAGFWNTSLSPLAAASLAQTVANRGVTLKPRIVRSVKLGKETVWEAPAEPVVLRRAVNANTAEEVTKMMRQTVAGGSAYKTFHDSKGRSFLPNLDVAGKTGTLTRHKENRHYTWLVAFAPASDPEIAVAALVVNTPRWRIKGPDLARDVLRAYFAAKGAPGVSPP
jgi:cell division protein FtsI/penicillin-binding protein 2